MGAWIIELGKVGAKALATSGCTALGKKGVEKFFPPKKDPFINELGKKVLMVAATAAATAAIGVVVDSTVKKQPARRNSTSDSNGPKKEH